MAAVEITISGVLYDKVNRTTIPVVLIGEASLTGLGVGGGPIPPQPPLGIWGPTDPRQTPPIYWPGFPGGGGGAQPPSGAHPSHPIYYPGAHPEHPIVIPQPPDKPPEPPTEVKPPPPGGGWAWSPEWGWGWYPGPTDPGPKT